MTWNLWWRFADWRHRLAAIAAVLREVQPDICCLQEVWSTPDADVAVTLGERNGMPHCVRSYSSDPGHWQRRLGTIGIETERVGTGNSAHGNGSNNGGSGYGGLDIGNAIISRWPVIRGADLGVARAAWADGDRGTDRRAGR